MKPLLFALEGSRDLGERVAAGLGEPLAPHEERPFEDGEHKVRPLLNVRERDVYVLHALYGEPGRSPDDKLCRLVFFCGALRDAGARRVTAVVPYLCYARKERKTQPRDPVTTRYVAGMIEAVGVDRVVGLDVHEVAGFQNAFHVARTEHLEARPLFAAWVQEARDGRPIAVVSPDVGGVKRAQRFGETVARLLGEPIPLAFMEKRRQSGVVSGEALVGDVRGRLVFILDDLVASGGTLARCAQACVDAGAVAVHALATHGLFTGDASATLDAAPLDRLVVTDSVAPFRLDPQVRDRKVTRLSVAPLIAEAILRLATGGSLVELLESGPPP